MRPFNVFVKSLARRAQSALLNSPFPSSVFTLSSQLVTGSFTGCPPSLGNSCNADQSRFTTQTGPCPSPAIPDAHATSAPTSHTCLLQQVFEMLDADGDGYVSADEMARHLGKLGLEEDKEVVIEGMDVQSAGERARGVERLDYEEFERVCEGDGGEVEVEAAFAVFDVDGDGKISVGELQQVLLRLGFTQCHDAAFCHLIIASLDPRLDGFIDFPHFRHMLLS